MPVSVRDRQTDTHTQRERERERERARETVGRDGIRCQSDPACLSLTLASPLTTHPPARVPTDSPGSQQHTFSPGFRSLSSPCPKTARRRRRRAPYNFMVRRFLMKLSTSNDMQTIEFCRLQFNFKLPSEQIAHRCKKFAGSEFVSINLANFRVYRQIRFIFTIKIVAYAKNN